MILHIKKYKNSFLILKKKSKYIEIYNPRIINFLYNIFNTMYHFYGVGLAASQVGKNLRLFIIDNSTFFLKKKERNYKRVFINPYLKYNNGKSWKLKEGCISIPYIIINIERYEFIHINYHNEYMENYEEPFQGLISRIILHEYDHINGNIILD